MTPIWSPLMCHPERSEGSVPRVLCSALPAPTAPGRGRLAALGGLVNLRVVLAAGGVGGQAAIEFGDLVGGQALQIILAAVVAGGDEELGAREAEIDRLRQ